MLISRLAQLSLSLAQHSTSHNKIWCDNVNMGKRALYKSMGACKMIESSNNICPHHMSNMDTKICS